MTLLAVNSPSLTALSVVGSIPAWKTLYVIRKLLTVSLDIYSLYPFLKYLFIAKQYVFIGLNILVTSFHSTIILCSFYFFEIRNCVLKTANASYLSWFPDELLISIQNR